MGPLRGFYKLLKESIGSKILLSDIDGPIAVDFSILLYDFFRSCDDNYLLYHQIPLTAIPNIRLKIMDFDLFMKTNSLVYTMILDGMSHPKKYASINRKMTSDNSLPELHLALSDLDFSNIKELFSKTTPLSRPDIHASVISSLVELKIPFIVAVSEADYEVAAQVNSGQFQYGFSTDGDLPVLGCLRTIYNIDRKNLTADIIEISDSNLKKLTYDLMDEEIIYSKLTKQPVIIGCNELIYFANFLGNDYLSGIGNQGERKVKLLLREVLMSDGDINSILNRISNNNKLNWANDFNNIAIFQGPCFKNYKKLFMEAFHLYKVCPHFEIRSDQKNYLSTNGSNIDYLSLIGFDPNVQFEPFIHVIEEYRSGMYSRQLDSNNNPKPIIMDSLKFPTNHLNQRLPLNSDLEVVTRHPFWIARSSLTAFLLSRGIQLNLTEKKTIVVEKVLDIVKYWSDNNSRDFPQVVVQDLYCCIIKKYLTMEDIVLEGSAPVVWVTDPEKIFELLRCINY